MINDPKVQEFIAQNPEVKAFFDAQMAGMDLSSEEAKDKVLNLMGQFRRQMEEQGYGRDQGDVFGGYVDGGETATTPSSEKDRIATQGLTGMENNYRTDGGRVGDINDLTAGGYVDGGETATTPSSEQDRIVTQGLTGMGQSYRVDGGRTEVSGPSVKVNEPADNGVDPNTQENTSSTPMTSEQQNQGIDTVLSDLDKENQAPGIQKDEKFFESKYKNFFDSDKGKEAWKKFMGGLKGAKTVDDLFSVMVFGMLNFPFDMINSYCDHRKAEAKRMEEEFMKKLDANHSSAIGRHHDTTETFIKKMSDVNNNAVSESDPKLWEAMQKVGVIDKYGNVDKTKLKEYPELSGRYNELSDSIGRQARDNFVQSYDRTNIPHDHPVWKKYSNEMDRLFKTTQGVGGINRENEPQRPEPTPPTQTPSAQTPPTQTPSTQTPPTPVPPTTPEYNDLRLQLAQMQSKLDVLTQIMGRQSNPSIIININQNGQDGLTGQGNSSITQTPLKMPQRRVTGNLQGNYYDNISTAFKDIQATLDNEQLTQQKLENMFDSRYAKTNKRTLEKTGGAAQDFGLVIKDKLEKGEVTLDQAKKLIAMGADILAGRKRRSQGAKDGLECLEQMLQAESITEMGKLFENHKESIKNRREEERKEKEQLKSSRDKKASSVSVSDEQIATHTQKEPQRPVLTPAQVQASEILKVSSEKVAELSAKEYKTEGVRKTQMTRANNKILDQMLGGMKKADQSKVLKALHEQILAQAKEKGLDTNAQNLQRAVENRCKELSGRKMVVSKRMTDNKIKQDIVSQVKQNVSAKRAVQMARTNTVQRTVPPMMRSKGNENA